MRRRAAAHGGFTLVELIVVLVVLAILAAIAIPGYNGYVDGQRERAALAECDQCVTAAQAISVQNYARGKDTAWNAEDTKSAVLELAGVPAGSRILTMEATTITVKRLWYQSAHGVTVTYVNNVSTLGSADAITNNPVSVGIGGKTVLDRLEEARKNNNNVRRMDSTAPQNPIADKLAGATGAFRKDIQNMMIDLNEMFNIETWAYSSYKPPDAPAATTNFTWSEANLSGKAGSYALSLRYDVINKSYSVCWVIIKKETSYGSEYRYLGDIPNKETGAVNLKNVTLRSGAQAAGIADFDEAIKIYQATLEAIEDNAAVKDSKTAAGSFIDKLVVPDPD